MFEADTSLKIPLPETLRSARPTEKGTPQTTEHSYDIEHANTCVD